MRFRIPVGFGLHRRNATRSLLRQTPGISVRCALDLGCGLGEMGDWLREAFPGARVVGLDVDARKLVEARASGIRVPLVRGTGLQLPFPDGTFDLVTMLEVIEHFADPIVLLREVRRVTSVGGLLVVSTPNRSSITAWTGRPMHRILGRPRWNAWDESHKRLYVPRELSEDLTRSGFQVRRVAGFWPLPEGIQRFPARIPDLRRVRGFVLDPSENPVRVRFGFVTVALAEGR